MISPHPLSPNAVAPAPQPSAEAFQQRRSFDFREFWHSCLERIWIIAICVMAGLFLALGYLARTPKLYQGHTVLEVDFQEPTVLNGDETSRMRSMFLATQEALRTIEQSLTNRTLLARVIRTENLAADRGLAVLGKRVSVPNGGPASGDSASGNATESASSPAYTPVEEAVAAAIAPKVKPVVRRGTRLIDLFVTNRDRSIAQRLAEAVGREYIRSSIERRASVSQDALRYLLAEEERLKKNLQKSEAAVAEYKAKTPDALQLGGGAAATGSQTAAGNAEARGGLVEDKLQELSSKLTAAKAERIKLEGELAQVAEAGQDVDALLAVQSISTSPIVTDRRRDLALAEANIGARSQRYKEKHPKMMAARAALKEAQDALRRAVLAQPALMKNGLEQARTTEASLESAGEGQEKAALALNKAAIGYQELARQAETDRALYESVLRQIKETNLTKDTKTNAVSVIEHSALPRSPVSPHPVITIILGLLGGLVAGLAFVYQADALDRSLKTVDQAEAVIGLPVLAAIPETKEEARKDGNREKQTSREDATYRLVAEDPGGPVAESFRNLRAALSLLGPESDRKIFLFTSALPSEGKSFASANYALALAQQGYRVLLIDGDLRRPNLDKIFRPALDQPKDGERPGIVGYLVGQSDVAAAAYPIPLAKVDLGENKIASIGNIPSTMGGHLDLMAGGRRAPNPAEILSGPRFAELLAEASRLYDRVVVDSAPVLAVSDTLLMTPFVQTVCMVVRAKKTPRNAVQRAIGLLATASGQPAGIVLNRLPTGRGAAYYYYYASPGYGEGEGSYAGHYGEQPAGAARESTGV